MVRKLFALSVLISLLLSLNLHAQKAELSAIGGYHFGGSYNGPYNSVKIDNSASWGVNFSYRIPSKDMIFLELQYIGQYTNVRMTPFNTSFGTYDETNVTVSYFLLMPRYSLPVSKKADLFGAFGIGLLWTSPAGNIYSDQVNEVFSIQIGSNIFFSEKAGIRLQAGMYAPTAISGGNLFIGSGGASYGVGSTTSVIQFNISGGLVFRMF